MKNGFYKIALVNTPFRVSDALNNIESCTLRAREAAENGAKILLCHHPEYYKTYLKDKKIDLIVAGHAHGGQWRLGRLAAFAPGQGIFPKYTKGVYDKRLVVSTGLKKSGRIPRIFNKPEIVYINI